MGHQQYVANGAFGPFANPHMGFPQMAPAVGAAGFAAPCAFAHQGGAMMGMGAGGGFGGGVPAPNPHYPPIERAFAGFGYGGYVPPYGMAMGPWGMVGGGGGGLPWMPYGAQMMHHHAAGPAPVVPQAAVPQAALHQVIEAQAPGDIQAVAGGGAVADAPMIGDGGVAAEELAAILDEGEEEYEIEM